MSKIDMLENFDQSQLWRFFVDGRFQKKYNGWVGYEAGEQGSVQALLNGMAFMLDNFDLSQGLRSNYLRELHKTCMFGVRTSNLKSSPGDIRYLNSGMPFFAKSTTYEHLVEVLAMRAGDGTPVFNNRRFAKTADELDVDEVFQYIKTEGKINYRNWYPNLDKSTSEALEGKNTLSEYYQAKHYVQMLIVNKMEETVARFNASMEHAKNNKERLKAIALVPRELELLHPFPDGNSRTFSCLTLMHLLMYWGFDIPILENPNLDNEVSLDQWVNEIEKGMEKTKELIEDPLASVYGYSIRDMDEENRLKFCDMASEVTLKLNEMTEIFLTPTRMATYTGGSWLGGRNIENLRFTGVGTYGTYSKGNVYFAMAIDDWIKDGKDPREELKKVSEKGMRAFVMDDLSYASGLDVPILQVDDCFSAFKECSIQVRQNQDPFTVLVTGTEGKTGAKVQFHHLLGQQAKTHAVLNSANTEVPVLRSLINLENDHAIEINEVSVGSDEAYRVERAMMVNPNICFFTNVGPNHMDMHKTLENIMIAKSSVVEGLREGGYCIVNSHIDHLSMLLSAIEKRRPGTPIISYGLNKSDNAQLLDQVFDNKKFGWNVTARIEDEILNYFVPMLQQHAPLASVGILLAVKKMGYDCNIAAKDYAGIKPYRTMGRLLGIQKRSGRVLFYDQSWRGAIEGMRSAFADISNISVPGRVVALVGGISVNKDSPWTQESHAELAQLINDSKIERLYTTGKYMDYVTEKLEDRGIFVTHNDDIDDLARLLYSDIKGGDLLFIIGSAYLYLGRVSDRLLKMKDRSNFDPNIDHMNLSQDAIMNYKVLVTKGEIERGHQPDLTLLEAGLSGEEFSKLGLTGESFVEARGRLLHSFFENLARQLHGEYGLRVVNHKIIAGGSSKYVYQHEFCKQWFNNLDLDPSLPRKQVFGSFFHFGDPKLLLHIDVATKNMHIGLVAYVESTEGYSITSLTLDEATDVIDRLELSKLTTLDINYRAWGPKWLSHDCGTKIDITKASSFQTFFNFPESSTYSDVLMPLIAKITSTSIR